MQQTIASPCTVSGRGYWSGVQNTLTFRPARVDNGIQFIRDDLPGRPRVAATVAHSSGQALRTRLEDRNASFDMIEHVMSALAGLHIDNVDVHCTAAEMPGFDGSSYAIALALNSSGIERQACPRATFSTQTTIEVAEDGRFVRFEPLTNDDAVGLQVEFNLDFGEHSPIHPSRFASVVTPGKYARDIAPARTFITQEDATALQASGVAQHVTDRDLLVFNQFGPVNNELRFPNECARHKALDLIGDLALVGVDLVGKLVAHRSGHQLNARLASAIREMIDRGDETNRKVA